MLSSQLAPRSPQSYFTEGEAAQSLGISLDHFRDLVRTHIAPGEDEPNIVGATYQSSDLVVLKLLAKIPSRP